MGRRKRAGFGDLLTSRAAFDRGEARCPSCRRPIGPSDGLSLVRGLGGAEPRFGTMRCGRCSAMLTLRFEEEVAGEKPAAS